MKKTIVAVAGVTLALLAGCSSDKGGGAPVAAGNGGDPCGVLTDDQVTKAYGSAPKVHNATPSGTHGCKWSFDDNLTSLTVYSGPAGDFAQRVDEKDHEPVAGVGDKAGWAKDAGVLFVVSGKSGLQIIIAIGGTNLGSPEHREHEKQAGISIARNALASLGVGKGDDATVPAEKTTEPSGTKTSPRTTETTETTKPEAPETSETTEPDEETTEPEPSE